MKEIKIKIPVPDFWHPAKNHQSLKINLSIVWIITVFFIMTSYDLTIIETLILSYFGIAIIWKWTSRISAFLALVLLASEPFLLALKKDAIAETLAVYAFYFLIITVTQEIISLKK